MREVPIHTCLCLSIEFELLFTDRTRQNTAMRTSNGTHRDPWPGPACRARLQRQPLAAPERVPEELDGVRGEVSVKCRRP
eukprot:875589-Prorocentrum_minimum.AAC.1